MLTKLADIRHTSVSEQVRQAVYAHLEASTVNLEPDAPTAQTPARMQAAEPELDRRQFVPFDEA